MSNENKSGSFAIFAVFGCLGMMVLVAIGLIYMGLSSDTTSGLLMDEPDPNPPNTHLPEGDPLRGILDEVFDGSVPEEILGQSPTREKRVRSLQGSITKAESTSGLFPVGGSCNIKLTTGISGQFACRAEVQCENELLYGGGSYGYFPCNWDSEGAAGEDKNTTQVDGDAAFFVDSKQHVARVRDDAAGAHGELNLLIRLGSTQAPGAGDQGEVGNEDRPTTDSSGPLQLDDLSVRGKLSSGVIADRLQNSAELLACVPKRRRGSIEARFIVGTDGKIVISSANGSADIETRDCVRGAIRQIDFPTFGEGIVVVDTKIRLRKSRR